ncbi:MAG: branched-chain amino acid ABC transporter permease [Devosia sp.]|uniref:branched-chain amino acid ABC transporter permease n=1 Tax=Devosia sp. 66-22 TaxID=1895753 RepID=UPI00092A606F|nr:branched-chain amino acid ABC transporter permease [Devosia sp. 66-22]MBN9346914.1 branched-chain amino acid ABC transporter permease [Devosia sp.]OJX48650.1 MAG: branched-chain amino acid ABC transporter permease [Devosia sp. 66-22]
MDELIFFINKVIISGTVIGSIYALGAVGVTLVFGILRFAHFAHGDMMTLGAFFTYSLVAILAAAGFSLPIPLGIALMPVAMALTSVAALGLDKGFYAPLRRKGAKPVTLLIASIGVTLMLQGVIRLFYGTSTRTFFESEPKDIFRIDMSWAGGTRPITITEPQAWMFGLVVVAVLALHFFLTRSRLGKGMRAMSDNPDLAQVSGINTALVVRVTWILAGALAAMAGTMLALDVSLKPDLAFNIILPIFAAAVVGGLGQTYGAIAGGFLVGFAETLAVFDWTVFLRPFRENLPEWLATAQGLSLVPTEYKLTVAFVILVIVLLVRPTGIFKGLST